MNVLFTKFENVFADLVIQKDIALDGKPRKLDIVSMEVMLIEACIGTKSARILFRHIRQFFRSSDSGIREKVKEILWC